MDRYKAPDAAAIAQSKLIERLAESERTMRDILVNLPVIVARFYVLRVVVDRGPRFFFSHAAPPPGARGAPL